MKTKLKLSLALLCSLFLIIPNVTFAGTVAKNGKCSTTADCQDTLYCEIIDEADPNSAICLLRGGADEACADNDQCLPDFYCDLEDPDNTICIARLPGGAACLNSNSCLSEDCGDDGLCTVATPATVGTTPDDGGVGTASGSGGLDTTGGSSVGTANDDGNIGTVGGTGGIGTTGGTGNIGTVGKTYKIPNPIGVTTINDLIAKLIRFFIGLSGSIALVVFIYGGLIWMTSGGDTKRITKGKDAIKYSIMGLAIMFSSYILVKFVLSAITSING